MRRFDGELAAERAGGLAMESHLGTTTAIVPHAADARAGEPTGGDIDLELLFQAAVTRPKELASACAGGPR
jgi:hypothetical protein